MKQNWLVVACLVLATESLLARLGLLASLAVIWSAVLGFATIKTVRFAGGLARRLRAVFAEVKLGYFSGVLAVHVRASPRAGGAVVQTAQCRGNAVRSKHRRNALNGCSWQP